LGQGAGSNLDTGSNNIDIGNVGAAGESNKIRIGTEGTQTATFIAGIYNVNEGGTPLAVYINSNGQLGTMSSSRRFKKEIKPMDQTSQAILGLQPVTFQYKSDPTGAAQFGLIAEEVAQVDPDLVVRDAQGEIYSVRYEVVNVMLLNEFLKEHRTVQELKSTVAKQEATIAEQQNGFESKIAHQQTQIEALTAGLQKVSAQVEMSRPAPQMVLNNQ
jgi:Chaperone of endosialidase